MARVPTPDTTSDGMSLITLMPFPAFNPLNWWALTTPTAAMRASMHTTKLALDAWRASADGARAMLRAQQNAALALVEASLNAAPEQVGEASATEEAESAEAPAFVQPMLEVTRAYGRVGKAFIVAQRDTMRAFADAGRPN